MRKINIEYLEKIQKYCDTRAYQKEFGYNEHDAEWSETPAGRIGSQLAVIVGNIEEIFEILDNEPEEVLDLFFTTDL